MSSIWVSIAILAATVLDGIYMLFRRFDIDYAEGMMVPDRWIAWGTCQAYDSKHDFRYFKLELPSYQWVSDYRGRECWGKLTLFRFAGSWQWSGYWPQRASL